MRAERHAGVVYGVALDDPKLPVAGLDDPHHVLVDDHSIDLRGHVVDRDVAGRAALGRGDEVAGALVAGPDQVGTAAGRIQLVAPLGVGLCGGGLTHSCLYVNQHYGVSCGGLAGGLVGHRAGDGSGLGQRAHKEQAQGNDAKYKLGWFHRQIIPL